MSKPTYLILACLGSALLGGCAGMQRDKRVELLETSLQAYAAAVRWGNYEEAARYRRQREGSPQALDLEFLRHIRVTGYDVVERTLVPGEQEAGITVAISFYHDDTHTLRTLRDRQRWWFREEDRRWYLDGELPDFQQALRDVR